MQRDVQVEEPWVVLRSNLNILALGSLDERLEVATKVIFEGTFSPNITRYSMKFHGIFDVEKIGLVRLLKTLDELHWCPELKAKDCHVSVEKPGVCGPCLRLEEGQPRKVQLTAKTPLCSLSKEALIEEVRKQRLLVKGMQGTIKQLERFNKELEKSSTIVSPQLQTSLTQILDAQDIENPMMKLFWEEQKKALNRDPRGMRWHPQMIRFAIYLQYNSPRAYEALRESGVIRLPNKSTLYDYTSVVNCGEGFQPHVFKSIKSSLAPLPNNRKFGVIMFDEMSIRSDIVYNATTDEIIGFVNPSSWSFSDKESASTVATHILAFMVTGINNSIKECVAYFATANAKSDFLYSRLWMTIAYLEMYGMKIIACVCDKAPSNQKLYRMHQSEASTTNVFSAERRPFFLLSDPPHLIKTLRNNLESSRSSGTKYLWKNGLHILWAHVWQVYQQEGLLRRTKLKFDHVRLSPASRMSVKLAAQVLSNRVGKAMETCGPELSETAKFVLQCDRFFDCLNGKFSLADEARAAKGATDTRKTDLLPYESIHDPRFQFLQDFQQYLQNWKDEVQARPGFSKKEKERMFLSPQTYEGVKTTVHGFIGCMQYLLSHGVGPIKANTFCQDPLENRFGRHRGLGVRSRNPSVKEYCHQENKLHLQRSLAMTFTPRGNITPNSERQCVEVSDEPLPKKKRK